MKKLIILLFIGLNSFAQSTEIQSFKKKQTVFALASSHNYMYSVNFDRIFYQKGFLLSYTIGAGLSPSEKYFPNPRFFLIPSLNFISGFNKHHLEISLSGYSYLVPTSTTYSPSDIRYGHFFAMQLRPSVGYRLQKSDKNYFLKVFSSPVGLNIIPLDEDKKLYYSWLFGLGVGYSF